LCRFGSIAGKQVGTAGGGKIKDLVADGDAAVELIGLAGTAEYTVRQILDRKSDLPSLAASTQLRN